jgi:hypothetical protein
MSSKDSRSASTDDDTGSAVLAPLNLLADLPRRQLALLSQQASAVFRASEAVRKIQQQAAHRASVHHDEVTERLRAPCDFNELLAIQAELMRFNMQEAAQYWQQVTSAALRTQADLVSTAGEMLDSGSEPSLDSLQRAFAASLNGGGAATPAH